MLRQGERKGERTKVIKGNDLTQESYSLGTCKRGKLRMAAESKNHNNLILIIRDQNGLKEPTFPKISLCCS